MPTKMLRNLGLSLFLAVPLAANAVVIYDEGVSGDLSDDGNTPTVLLLGAGSNDLIGSIGSGDDDFFSFTIGAGQSLDSIVVVNHSPSATTSFIGIEFGPVFINTQGNSNYEGVDFFGAADIGQDILGNMAASNGNFTAPLGAGTYSFWLDEGGSTESYTLRFNVTAPEPGIVLLAFAGLLGVAATRRRGAPSELGAHG